MLLMCIKIPGASWREKEGILNLSVCKELSEAEKQMSAPMGCASGSAVNETSVRMAFQTFSTVIPHQLASSTSLGKLTEKKYPRVDIYRDPELSSDEFVSIKSRHLSLSRDN